MNSTVYAVVEIGDFVKSSLDDFMCGFVLDIGHVCGIYGYLVELANGTVTFLPNDFTLVMKFDKELGYD